MFKSAVVDINVTGECNLTCRYCFGELSSKPGISKTAFQSALALANHVEATSIELCGGEPLLYNHFDWAVELARSQGFQLILRTNALLLPEKRSFVLQHFDAVGISLDGDAKTNHQMRPESTMFPISAEDKFSIPLREINKLRSARQDLRIILASVATKINIDGLKALAKIVVQTAPPADLWKIYQFVPNHFRAKRNEACFKLSNEEFVILRHDMEAIIGPSIELSFRNSETVDGSCLIVDSTGGVRIGANTIGNVTKDSLSTLSEALSMTGAQGKIEENKRQTYRKEITRPVDDR